MPLALSTGHEVGLAVTAGAFIAFALASSFLFPRFRPQYPGGGLPAFIVIAFVFFFGMLTAVEVFGAEEKEGGEETVAEATSAPTTTQQPTSASAPTTTQQPTSTSAATTTTTAATTSTAPKPQATTVQVTETEFKIALGSTDVKAGKITFDVKNGGKLPHDLAIKGGEKTKLIQAGGSAQLTVTLSAGKYHLYCSVPGHEAAGMKVDITVS